MLTKGYIKERREPHHFSALEQLNRQPRLVLLGDPGSGKTTFANFVALCLAGEGLHRSEANLALLTAPLPAGEEKEPKPQPWEHGALLPVVVILRDFAASGLPEPGERATAQHLWRFITAGLEAAALGEYAAHLRRELLTDGGLLLLDGLDEVPQADRRRVQLRQAVEDFATSFPKCRLLVTSRTYAYQKQDWRLANFAAAELAAFTPEQIASFIERWYTHVAPLRKLAPSDAQGRAELLKHAVLNNERLLGLAERPLLLTLMASLHAWRGGSLPEKREQLYADTVDLLLDWWENPKAVHDARGQVVVSQPSLAEWLKVDRDQVRALLNELAYQAHAAQPDLSGTADVPEGELVSGLLHLSRNPEASANPALLVDYLSQRAGLLIPRGVGVYTFPHRTFQEYLAACYLTDHGFPDDPAGLARSDPDRWREVCLLAGAKAYRGGAFGLWALVDALYLPSTEEHPSTIRDAWGALLAGQALAETADLSRVSQANQVSLRRVQHGLVSILQAGQLPAVERARTGDALARLGDPRFDPDHWFLPAEPLLGFVEIPAGPFWMGSDPEKDSEATKDEQPQHEVHLPSFYISRYPVTVAQFRQFMEASGYEFDDWQWNPVSNHPVVSVTWYDALVYCRWLARRLGDKGGEMLANALPNSGERAFWEGLADGALAVTLPSEVEWEKAARGTGGRIYPWGNAFDTDKANTGETGLGDTSPVGCFPAGASPYGLQDMSGNVWEWTRSSYQGYPYQPDGGREDESSEAPRVLRGGSFIYSRWGARCALRYWLNPDGRDGGIGFRVGVSPVRL